MRRIALNLPNRHAVPAMILALFLAAIFSAGMLAAQSESDYADPAGGGALMLRGKGVAEAIPAMQLGTDIAVDINGPVARVTVTQAFRNTSENWMEATYLYPLPDDGAVDSLNMVVGQRIFVGQIKPREEARAIYEQAKTEGRKSGLVEQARANLFRNSVANVGPGETVLMEIEFQAPVQQLAGEYALRLPLVAAPRYISPDSVMNDQGEIDLVQVADAVNVTAPLAHPALGSRLNPVSINVTLDPGFVPENIESPYHPITVTQNGPQQRIISLAGGEVPANRDFKLSWHAAGDEPALGLFQQTHDGLDYLMATITPPQAERQGPALPREMIFVIDNSGSMGGESMVAAKTSLLHALDTLQPKDRFNIIRFDDTMTVLFPDSYAAYDRAIEEAKIFTSNLEANGGTEMLPALRAALWEGGHSDVATAIREMIPSKDLLEEQEMIRQVIFLTDGSLSNEADMMAEIAQNRGRSRIFMVGMGSAPNSFLMRRMAEEGRGTFTHIGNDREAADEMRALLDRLTAPVATNLAVTIDGSTIDLAPRDLPDLYRGEPLVLLGRTERLAGTLTITGKIGRENWSHTVNLDDATTSSSAAKMWAYRRIAEVEAQRYSGEIDGPLADAAIEEVGIDFHLVTSRTSLVAEDTTPSRPEGATLIEEELPLLLPAGWDFDTLFKGQNDAAHAAHSTPGDTDQLAALDLPKTATGFMTALLQGLMLLLVGLGALIMRRRTTLHA